MVEKIVVKLPVGFKQAVEKKQAMKQEIKELKKLTRKLRDCKYGARINGKCPLPCKNGPRVEGKCPRSCKYGARINGQCPRKPKTQRVFRPMKSDAELRALRARQKAKIEPRMAQNAL